jgi:hypothetical protein
VKKKSGGPSAQPSLAASFSTTFIRGEARWTPHPLKDRGDDDRYAVPTTDLAGPVDRTNLRGRRLLFWVNRVGLTMSESLPLYPQIADIPTDASLACPARST